MTREIKAGDTYVLHSENGMDYKILVDNVNYCREPSMRYAVDAIDPDGNSYYRAVGSLFFCGDDFMSKCEYVQGDDYNAMD